MKKIISVIILTLVMLLNDAICFNPLLKYGGKLKIAEALEEQSGEEKPGIYYDTLFEEMNPKQLIAYNNGIFIATDEKVYEYNTDEDTWLNLDAGKPIETTMGTLKGLNYSSMKSGGEIKDYKKIVADINDDGKEIYELNKTNEGKSIWVKIMENGKFCKPLEDNAEAYKIISFYDENTCERKVKTNSDEFYISENNLYGHAKDKEPQLIKSYEENGENLKFAKFGKEVFIYGGSFGVERIVSSKNFNGDSYSVYSIGEFNFSEKVVISDIASPDDGHTIYVIDSENNVYKVIMSNTWIPYKKEVKPINEMYCTINEQEKIKEILVGEKTFRIVKNDEWGKSYITVNDKVLQRTIKDSFQYPDQITRFSEADDYIYFWNNASQPIRVNINDESVDFMGQGVLFNDITNFNEKIIKDNDGNIYLEKGDKRIYRYVEKNKFYDIGLPYKASDIKIVNEQCYAICDKGLFLFNSRGQWENVIEGDISKSYDEQLIVLGSSLYSLSNGSLYKLNKAKRWELVESKVNKGLTSVYYVNDDENKVYFVSEEEDKNYVTIIDYTQNQWSKTKALPDINGIKSVAVEGANIYVGTQYIDDGVAYVYKNCTWIPILPQLGIDECVTLKSFRLIKQDNQVFFQISEKGKEYFEIWQLKDGSAFKVEDGKEKEKLIVKLNQENIVYTNQIGVTYALKNGKVMRKVI